VTKFAGVLIVIYGAAHTLGALTVLSAGQYAGSWFSGALWRDDLASMSPANSAYWLSLNSFGIPLIIVGALVVWLDGRGVTPPSFVGWALTLFSVVGAVVLVMTPWPLLLTASALLVVQARRASRSSVLTQ
jgi:hypothetical protein